ncbi:hypothetical protein OHA72_42745 [Dactylosporangium sp. NBC_01737]|uniref:hypothetical protein n=1 Tax=Dactylosporangium sp. NBC_01737 TaxID=2975959 RepID=UPI002E0E6640|nr:hypothetical protein OHA72_42745 [Dactylosporangium sp. NBC_01737]
MHEYQCPGCGRRGMVGDPGRVAEPCGRCAAVATWEALPLDTQRAIDEAIEVGAVPAVAAMHFADPPIRMPHSLDVLQFRLRAREQERR